MERDISRAGFKNIWQAIPRGEVKNEEPHYGPKEHASVDVNNGFILAKTLTHASIHDTVMKRTFVKEKMSLN